MPGYVASGCSGCPRLTGYEASCHFARGCAVTRLEYSIQRILWLLVVLIAAHLFGEIGEAELPILPLSHGVDLAAHRQQQRVVVPTAHRTARTDRFSQWYLAWLSNMACFLAAANLAHSTAGGQSDGS